MKRTGEKVVSIITKDRIIHVALRERITSCKLFICQGHYREDQIIHHATRKTIKPGQIPELNFLLKPFHLYHKIFSLTQENISPLCQTKWLSFTFLSRLKCKFKVVGVMVHPRVVLSVCVCVCVCGGGGGGMNL